MKSPKTYFDEDDYEQTEKRAERAMNKAETEADIAEVHARKAKDAIQHAKLEEERGKRYLAAKAAGTKMSWADIMGDDDDEQMSRPKAKKTTKPKTKSRSRSRSKTTKTSKKNKSK